MKLILAPRIQLYRNLQKKGISKTTLTGLSKSEPSINHPSKKRKQKSAFDAIDKYLVLWLTDKTNRVPLSGPLLKQKAEEFAKQLEYKNWVCSDGWLHR